MLKKILIATVVISSSIGLTQAQDKANDLAIIVNKNSALDNVTADELGKIFRAEKTKGPDGTKFVLAVPAAGSPEHAAMLAGVYGFDEAGYGKYFLQATFVGQVQSAPKQLAGGAALCGFVAGAPGGITCARASDVTDAVKIVKVDGHAPGEPDYKLKIK